ncbi:MAG: bile acid:sodium symporter [Verrucomicrobia bacterium]|nr:bile acid:sodium symporter [Verrucomicrobiota bacterium]
MKNVARGSAVQSPSTTGAILPRPSNLTGWFRGNGFLLGLCAAVVLGFAFPQGGSRNGVLHPELVGDLGIALILFLQGLSIPLGKMRTGAGNWRLHATIQTFTFIVFPLVGLLFAAVVPRVWPREPPPIRAGMLYLCVLPSTVSTSVVLTAVAGGNVAGAIFSAAFSNIIGVVLTPVCVQLLMSTTGQHGHFGALLGQILLLTLVPFTLGMLLRPLVWQFVDANKRWVNWISNAVILFIVYSAFCDSVENRIWHRFGYGLTLGVLAMIIALYLTISCLVQLASHWLKLNREDFIAAYFCSVNKTLAMGVPLAILIFGARTDLSLILLPIMFYHPFQLLVNGILANRWARQASAH